jgi:hypothetical protein
VESLSRSAFRQASSHRNEEGRCDVVLSNDELRGPRGAGYRRMIEVSAAGRAGTPEEVGKASSFLSH